MNFSSMKNRTRPVSRYTGIVILNPSSAASGIRWKKASPKRLPAEKLTINKRNLDRSLSLMLKVNTPTRDIRLTTKTLSNE
jgi:hypothetical protein